MNLGTETEIVNLAGEIPHLGDSLKVVVASDNAGYKKRWGTTKLPDIFFFVLQKKKSISIPIL